MACRSHATAATLLFSAEADDFTAIRGRDGRSADALYLSGDIGADADVYVAYRRACDIGN